MPSRQQNAEYALIGVTLIWGSTFYITQITLQYVSPILLSAIRFLIAAGITFVISRKEQNARLFSRPLAIAAGFLLAMTLIFQNLGLQRIPAPQAAFLSYSYALLIPPLQLLISKKPVSLGSLLGITIALLGTYVLTLPIINGLSAGAIFIFICNFFFAFYIITVDKLQHRGRFWLLLSYQFFFAALISGVAVITEPVRFSFSAIALLLYLAVMGTVVVLGIQVYFQPRTSPSRATTIYALEPVFAALIAWMLGNQGMVLHEIIGASLIVGGVLTMELIFPRRKSPQAE